MRKSLFIAFGLVISIHALADDAAEPNFVGAGGWYRPTYDGADTQRTVAVPFVSYYGHPWFVRSTHGVLEGGARVALGGHLTLGAQLAYEGGRPTGESPFLTAHNVPGISPGVSWGAHAELKEQIGPMPIWLLVRHRRNADAVFGAQTDARLTAGIYGGEQLSAGVFAQTTWADGKSMQAYYGITPQQSAVSGLPVFTPGAGRVFDAGGVLWGYDLNREWLLLGSLEVHQVLGSVSNSPLVRVRSNNYASLGVAYKF